MDIATIAMKQLRKEGKLADLDESEEINACSINVDVNIDGKIEKYLRWVVMQKETLIAVKEAYKYTKENESCLLSPAAASYGFYLNFEKRGEHYKQLVHDYSNK